MPRTDLLTQIAKAAAAGDLEKVKQLTEKAQAKKVVKPRKKKVAVENSEEHVFRPKSANSAVDRKNVDDMYTKTRPFKKREWINQWSDDFSQAKDDIELDKKLAEKTQPAQPRPSDKIKVACSECQTTFELWPTEVIYANWTCDTCLVKKKR